MPGVESRFRRGLGQPAPRSPCLHSWKSFPPLVFLGLFATDGEDDSVFQANGRVHADFRDVDRIWEVGEVPRCRCFPATAPPSTGRRWVLRWLSNRAQEYGNRKQSNLKCVGGYFRQSLNMQLSGRGHSSSCCGVLVIFGKRVWNAGSGGFLFRLSRTNTVCGIEQPQSRKKTLHAGRHFDGLGSMWHG